MKNLRNQNGAITIIALATILFILSFLMSSFMIVSNRARKERETSEGIQEIYSNNQDLNEIYNSLINSGIIPIYTSEQLLKIGTNEIILINNKYCKMTWDATYALMEDLSFTGNWTPINSNTNFTGYFEGNGHTITVTSYNNEVTVYSSVNNYQ